MNLALLEKRMSELKLKPIDVAARTGVALNTVLRILSGQSKRPQPRTIRDFADLLGVTEEQLFPPPKRKRQ